MANVLVCEAQTPGKTSVEIDFHLAGYKLGELLERLIEDPTASPQPATYV